MFGEGQTLSNGHLSKVGTLLLPVKSMCLFKTLYFPSCAPDSMAFFAIWGLHFAALYFIVSFFSAAKLCRVANWLITRLFISYFFPIFLFSILVNAKRICFLLKKKNLIFALLILKLENRPLDKCPTTGWVCYKIIHAISLNWLVWFQNI